jgi:hypothetical protein
VIRGRIVRNNPKPVINRAGARPKATLARAAIVFSLFLFISAILNGCQTRRYAMENVQIPYVVVKQTIMKTMPGGVRSSSPNGREMISNYFAPRNFYQDATDRPERAYAKVVILGSSRPFKLDIQGFREVRERGSREYVNLGEDPELTRLLVQYFKDALADRREDRNVIDDFRAF